MANICAKHLNLSQAWWTLFFGWMAFPFLKLPWVTSLPCSWSKSVTSVCLQSSHTYSVLTKSGDVWRSEAALLHSIASNQHITDPWRIPPPNYQPGWKVWLSTKNISLKIFLLDSLPGSSKVLLSIWFDAFWACVTEEGACNIEERAWGIKEDF